MPPAPSSDQTGGTDNWTEEEWAEWMEWERVKEEQEESDAGEEQPTNPMSEPMSDSDNQKGNSEWGRNQWSGSDHSANCQTWETTPYKKPYWARSRESKRQKGRQDSWGGHYVRGGYYDYRGVFYQFLGRM